MRKNIVTIVILVCLRPSVPLAESSPLDLLNLFGHVESVEATVDNLGVCLSRSLVLVDENGMKLGVLLGYSASQPHSGFRVGAIIPKKFESTLVPIGSDSELRLLGLFSSYIDSNFAHVRAEWPSKNQPIGAWDEGDQIAVFMLDTIAQFENQGELRKALYASFSQKELDAIFSTEYADLDAEEKEVFKKICQMYGGCPVRSGGGYFGYEEVGGLKPETGGCL